MIVSRRWLGDKKTAFNNVEGGIVACRSVEV